MKKNRKILDDAIGMLEKKGNVFNEHVIEESIANFFHSSPHTPYTSNTFRLGSSTPNIYLEKGQKINLGYILRVIKGK